MDAAGIDLQLVSAPPFVFGSTSEDDELVMEVTRRSNDALAEHVAEGGGRLAALGTVPVGLPGAAREAARCLDELGMAGVTTGTFGGGRELDDPVNEDVWALLSERRASAWSTRAARRRPPGSATSTWCSCSATRRRRRSPRRA